MLTLPGFLCVENTGCTGGQFVAWDTSGHFFGVNTSILNTPLMCLYGGTQWCSYGSDTNTMISGAITIIKPAVAVRAKMLLR